MRPAERHGHGGERPSRKSSGRNSRRSLHFLAATFLATTAASAGQNSGAERLGACVVDPRVFNYGPIRDNAEAEQLAMTLSGQLRAPNQEYDRIVRDLALIRSAHPLLQSVIDDPDYEPTQLLVSLAGAGPWPDYQNLSGFYQAVSDEVLFGSWRVLTFCGTINAPALALIYMQSPDVDFAEPNTLVGTDDFIHVSATDGTYQYFIEDGYHDCFDGCDCRMRWTFDVDEAGEVVLLSYSQFDALGLCTFPDGACCTGGGSCSVMQAETCEQLGRTPWGPTVSCDADADGDGLDAGCGDRCAADPAKTQPGACGCGNADEDLNGDGQPDCIGVIPTVSTWGAVVLALVLAVAGTLLANRGTRSDVHAAAR